MIRQDRKRKRHYNRSAPAEGPRGALDLFVALPKKASTSSSSDVVPQKVMIQSLLTRLYETGFEQAALTHTVYGRPAEHDRVDTTLPVALLQKKKSDDIRVLRRLHVVVENLSDVGLYGSISSPIIDILNEYDLVSLSPRNDAAFHAACSSAIYADIITLDSATSFKIRATDVKAAIANNIVFELPYAAAVLNRPSRKALVQTCREFQMASLGLKPHVIFSSGNRNLTEDTSTDLGPMALRTAGDLANLLQAVLGFDSRTASKALSVNGQVALEHARQRRFGKRSIVVTGVSIESPNNDTMVKAEESVTKTTSKQKVEPVDDNDPSSLEGQRSTERDGEQDRGEDGFIAFE
jgi:RNase P/RNase MRP subunit p30